MQQTSWQPPPHLMELQKPSQFFKSVSAFLSNLPGNLTKLIPAMTLLGINLDNCLLIYRMIVAHILTVGRLNITSLCKSTEAPNFLNVLSGSGLMTSALD